MNSNARKLKKRIQYIIALPILLGLILLGLAIYENGLSSKIGITSVILLVAYIILVVIIYFRMLPAVRSVLVDYSLEQGKIQRELLRELEIPYAILDASGHVMWSNDMFHTIVGVSPSKRIRKPIESFFPELTPDMVDEAESMEIGIIYGERNYKAVLRRIDLSKVFEKEDTSEELGEDKMDDIVIALYLFDETELKEYEKEVVDQKLYVGLLYLDNYDEVMDSLEDVKHSILTALVERKINMYLGNIDAIVKHIENDKYLFVFRQKFMQTLRDDKFSILDEVKAINVGNEIAMTLSIGIGADDAKSSGSYQSAYENARAAIGMAMGRGGDQAAVKYGEKVSYYGGKSAGTEKTTRVKARVKAQAFEELLLSKEKVLIMAHKRPDSDAFGSAIGIYRMVTSMGKKAHIVLNEVTDAIRPVANTFMAGNLYDGVFLSSTEAVQSVDKNTVVVVCDVNRPNLTECEELLSLVPTVVVFDHHRQSNESIQNATLSYIEPFASSACEMITEMYQYMSKQPKLSSTEADAMYAGILIDTDNFLVKTGVRTFEAASYLRKSGADVTRVRKMFRSSMMEMREKAQGISNAEIFLGRYALSFVEPDPDSGDAPTVAVAKVANELLNVENIVASFVVTEAENGILYVSARSIGDVNVQIVMERFNGGGHANVAGAQLEGVKRTEFFDELRKVLKEMQEGGEI